jgi:hypothetical protein
MLSGVDSGGTGSASIPCFFAMKGKKVEEGFLLGKGLKEIQQYELTKVGVLMIDYKYFPWVAMFYMLWEFFSRLGKRLFPVKRYYSFWVQFLLMISFLVIPEILPYQLPDWMGVIVLAVVLSLIKIFFPVKPK